MHLSSFGLIALDGSVNKPEPGLDFANYQVALAHYSATIALRARLQPGRAAASQAAVAEPAPVEPPVPETPSLPVAVPPRKLQKVPTRSAAALVKMFRK